MRFESAQNCHPFPFSKVILIGYRVMVCKCHLLINIISSYLVRISVTTYIVLSNIKSNNEIRFV